MLGAGGFFENGLGGCGPDDKRNGQRVQRKLIASFQVGPIAQNPVTTAQILEVIARAAECW